MKEILQNPFDKGIFDDYYYNYNSIMEILVYSE